MNKSLVILAFAKNTDLIFNIQIYLFLVRIPSSARTHTQFKPEQTTDIQHVVSIYVLKGFEHETTTTTNSFVSKMSNSSVLLYHITSQPIVLNNIHNVEPITEKRTCCRINSGRKSRREKHVVRY